MRKCGYKHINTFQKVIKVKSIYVDDRISENNGGIL